MKTRKFLSLLLALAMVFAMVIPAMADDPAPETTEAYTVPADVSGKIVILHTNDTHGADLAVQGTSIGIAGVAQLKKDFEAAGAKVLLLSAGDSIMGKPLVSADKGKSAFEFMNAAGYDAMTVGNHEMDFGSDNLKELAKSAKFSILCADMTTEANGKTVFDANKVFDIDGIKIGVFGLATPETRTKADASKMPGITFPEKESLYAVAQAQVDELKKAGADLIVCLGHLGISDESVGNQSIDVAKNVNGIDLFIDGHSHSTTEDIINKIDNADKNNIVNGTKIVSTGTAFANVGVVVYDSEAKTLTDSLISAKEYSSVDETVAKLVSDRDAAVKKAYGEKIAETAVDLNGSRSGGVSKSVNNGEVEVTFPAGIGNRTAETNLGDFATDAILWQARKVLGEDKVDAALTNGGGIRETLAAGDISKLDLLAVFPFGNTVATIDVTGAQLLEALEAGTFSTPDAIGAFPQVSGIEYTIDTTVPYEKGDQYPGSTYFSPAKPGSRVTITSVNGAAWDAEKTYTIATNDFTAKGGDTFGIFKAVGGWKDVGVGLEDALINYTAEELKGVVTAEQYGEPQGRITIKKSVTDIFSDVKANDWFVEAVQYAYDNKLMNGTDKGFEPLLEVNNTQMIQLLWNLSGNSKADAAVSGVEGEWYADAVNWAASVKLIDGGEFSEQVITRGEVRDMMTEYGKLVEKDYSNLFQGDENGNLLLDQSLTRSEMAQILVNIAD